MSTSFVIVLIDFPFFLLSVELLPNYYVTIFETFCCKKFQLFKKREKHDNLLSNVHSRPFFLSHFAMIFCRSIRAEKLKIHRTFVTSKFFDSLSNNFLTKRSFCKMFHEIFFRLRDLQHSTEIIEPSHDFYRIVTNCWLRCHLARGERESKKWLEFVTNSRIDRQPFHW